MKKLIICLTIIIAAVAVSSAQEPVLLDNSQIQQYNGVAGRWVMIAARKTLDTYIHDFSVQEADVVSLNGMSLNEMVGKYVFIPFSPEYLSSLEAQNATARLAVDSSVDEFIWPVEGVDLITSVMGLRYGQLHPGIDIPAQRGVPVRAVMDGRVTFASYAGGYGNMVEIEHRNNFTTRYGHNSFNLVKKGDFVKKGQIIALVGSTGHSTGNHVHFEIRSCDVPLDPLDFVPEKLNLRLMHALKNWKR